MKGISLNCPVCKEPLEERSTGRNKCYECGSHFGITIKVDTKDKKLTKKEVNKRKIIHYLMRATNYPFSNKLQPVSCRLIAQDNCLDDKEAQALCMELVEETKNYKFSIVEHRVGKTHLYFKGKNN